MQKNEHKPLLKRIFLFLLSIAILLMIGISIYAYSLMSNPDIIVIGKGESYTLSGKVDNFSIRSYNADVVTVTTADSVTGNNLGDAVVCVKYNYFDRDFYRFNVVDAPKSISLNEQELCLGKGETAKLHSECKSGNHSFDLSFESSDENVATFSSGSTLTANNVGECEVYALAYNGIKASCCVSVKEAPTKVTLNKNSLTLGESEEFELKLNFKDNEFSNAIEYSSDNPDVATVNDGVITAKKAGECTITAKCFNGVSSKCKLTVKKLPEELSLLMLDKYSVGSRARVLYSISKDSCANDVNISVSDTDILSVDKNDPMLLHCNKGGEATVTLTLKNGVSAKKTITVGNYKNKNLNFSSLNQFPTLPTGCEVVSLTSVLNHYGMDVSMTTMADKYMPKKEYDYYSVSPHDYFYGTPYTWDGFGCFSGCIVKTAHNYFEDKNIDDYVAVDITGCTANELYDYIENGVPVITWVTSNFVTPTVDGSWSVNGETITWCNHEHCLVTKGYDKNAGVVYVADNSGGYSYSVSKSQFEKVFEGMGSMAVVVLKKDK